MTLWLLLRYMIMTLLVIAQLVSIIFTFPPSLRLVIMTIVFTHFSHTILQKSATVDSMGPWHAM